MIENIDYTAAKFWWDVFITFICFAAACYTFIKTRHSANAKDIRLLRDWIALELEKRDGGTSDLGVRLSVVERDIQHAPTHRQVAEVHDRLTTVTKELSEIAGEMKAYTRQVRMINEVLLAQSSKRGN